jgi:acyl carrier protein
MHDALAARVLALVATQARRPVTEISSDMTLAALGLDSLAQVELVFALEEAFDIRLPFSAEGDAGLHSVSTLIAAVRGQASAGAT